MCGGASAIGKPLACDVGLSPRVRGSRIASRPKWPGSRSIPACAGEPPSRRPSRPPRRVYPRVCGGAIASAPTLTGDTGLSPRVRGSPWPGALGGVGRGSIPACAGEPCRAGRRSGCWRVYPRVCGGAVGESRLPGLMRGLSPRVRGSRNDGRKQDRMDGSIPACAGEPRGSWSATSSGWVYPRVCGGAPDDLLKGHRYLGLSPRVRGSRAGPLGRQRNQGSIPACAGEPGAAAMSACATGVYPRVCGGARDVVAVRVEPAGLSPRVRGSLVHGDAGDPRHGSIPACAGEPSFLG